jgi:thiamine kinase-like enzyme
VSSFMSQDYEYASFNPVAYDIANISVSWQQTIIHQSLI